MATILASSMTFIDGTVVNVALPALQSSLGATIADVQWVIEAYALLLGGLILVGGSLGDQFGRKRMFLAGTAVFTAASILCGLAPSVHVLIAARAVQGIGAAFLVPGSLAVITATFDAAERGRAIGTWSGFTAITTAVGPVLGGWAIEHVSWRAIFFLNVPLAVIVFLISIPMMRESSDPSRTPRIDWPGGFLAVAGLGGVVFALLQGPPSTFASPAVLGAAIGGATALALFVVVERRSSSPMLPLALFRSRTFTLVNLLTLLLYGALGVFLWLVPMTLIQASQYSATEAGAALLPLPILMFVLSRWSGGLVASVGARLPLTIGPAIVAAGLWLFARPGFGASYWMAVFPAVLVLGLGLAIVVAPLTTAAMDAVDVRHSGVASGVNNAVSRVAGLVAIAVFGIVMVNAFDHRISPALDRIGLPAAARSALNGELSKLAGADLSRPEIAGAAGADRLRAAREAIDRSFLSAFESTMKAAAAVALAAAGVGSRLR